MEKPFSATLFSNYVFSKLPQHRRKMYLDYYGVVFDKNYCPLKKLKNHNIFHPLLAAYLIYDFSQAYAKSQDSECIEIAEIFSKNALTRSSIFLNSIAFMNSDKESLSYVPGDFYSALTQAWYIRALCRLHQYKPIFKTEIRQIFNSLNIKKGIWRCSCSETIWLDC